MEEVLYRTLRKFKVLNKNVTIQGDRKAVPENYSNAGHTKKSFCSCFTLVLHILYKDWMSKQLKHLRAEIQHTEILWPQIQKPSFSLCTGAGAVVVVYWSKWLVLWIAFPCSTEAEHSRNVANVSHSSVCPHWMRSCASLFPNKTNTWGEIPHIELLSLIVLPEVSKYRSNPIAKSHVTLWVSFSHLPHLPTTQVLPELFNSYYAPASGTMPQKLIFAILTSTEKLHSIPLLLRKTKMGTTAFLNHFRQAAYCQNWGGMMLLLKSLIFLLQDSEHLMKTFPDLINRLFLCH